MLAGSLISRLPQWAVIRDARRRQRRRLRRRLTLLAAIAVVGLGLFGVLQPEGAPPQTTPTAIPSAMSVDVGGTVLQARARDGRVWVLTCVSNCGGAPAASDVEQLVEVDARSGAIVRELPAGDASAFALTGDGIWVAHSPSGRVTRIDPEHPGIANAGVSLRLPAPVAPHDRRFLPQSLSVSGAHLWVSTARGWLAEIDSGTGKLTRMVRTPSEDNVTTTDRYGTWVAEDLDGIGVLGPHRAHVAVHPILQAGLPLDVTGVFSGAGRVWALASTNTGVSAPRTLVLVIDPRTGRVLRRVPAPEADGAVVVDGAIYVGGLDRGHIYRVDGNGRLQTFDTQRRGATLMASSPGLLWAATSTSPGLLVSLRLPPA